MQRVCAQDAEGGVHRMQRVCAQDAEGCVHRMQRVCAQDAEGVCTGCRGGVHRKHFAILLTS